MITRFAIAAVTALSVTATPAANFDGATLAQLAKTNEVAALTYVAGFSQGWGAHIAVQEGLLTTRHIPIATFRKMMTDGRVMFCLPDDITNGTTLDIVLAWLAANPGEASKSADYVTWAALVKAYPCKTPLKSVSF